MMRRSGRKSRNKTVRDRSNKRRLFERVKVAVADKFLLLVIYACAEALSVVGVERRVVIEIDEVFADGES